MSFFKTPPATVSDGSLADDIGALERFNGILRRVRIDYEEMPGLSLTARQAARLWNVSPDVAQRVLTSLVAIGYLKKSTSGFVRTVELLASPARRVH
jgi:Fic family protein